MSRKNHKIVGGRLLQTDKKFSALKQRQKTWIYEMAQIEYERYIAEYKKQPRKAGKDIVVEHVAEKIMQREIWIPHYELKNAIGKFIDRRNRRTNFEFTEENKLLFTKAPIDIGVQKPRVLKTKFSECTDELRTLLVEKLQPQITAYILQTKKLPKGKVQDGHIKTVLNGFNAKQYKKFGSKVSNDDGFIAAYTELAKILFDTLHE